MAISPLLLGLVPEWALLAAAWLDIGVFAVVSFVCYGARRGMSVPGDGVSRFDDACVSACVGGSCALVAGFAVVVWGVLA